MAGPWEKYATQPQEGPWAKYAQQPAPSNGLSAIATTDNGGVVYRDQSGNLSYADQGYSTSDPEKIRKIMEGAKPVDLVQSDIDRQRIDASPVYSRATQIMEGVPFVGSYADEALSAIDPKRGEAYRLSSEAMRREKPGQSTALNVTGAIAGSIPAAVAAGPAALGSSATTLGSRAVVAGGIGAAVGGVEGAVHGYGDQSGGGRAANAQQGVIFGTMAGGVLGAAAPYASEGIKKFLTAIRGSDAAVIAKQLGISAPAARVIKNALDAGDMAEAQRALYRAGDSAMLADAGQPARELLDAAANTGGAAGRIVKTAIEDRSTAASHDLTSALDKYFGRPNAAIGTEIVPYDPKIAAMGRNADRAPDGWVLGGGVNTYKTNLRTITSAIRKQVYDRAYSKPIDYASPRGEALEGLLKRVPQSAISDANALMAAEGVQSNQIIARMTEDGRAVIERLPDVRQIDYLTRALQGVADKADGQGKLGGKTPLGSAYAKLARDIRNVLKGAVPEYGAALDTASDVIAKAKAVESGYALLRPSTTREMVTEGLRGATVAEKNAVKVGVRTYIDDTMANVTRALTDQNMDAREAIKLLRDVSSRANNQKLRFLLGQRQADAFFGEIDKAAATFELRAALAANSKTAIRQSIQGSVEQQTAPGALEVLGSGEPANAAKRFVQLFTGNSKEAQALREAGIYEDIANALTQVRGGRATTALNIIQKAINGQKINEQQAGFIGRVVAETGALAGSHEASKQLSTQ